MLKKSKEQQIVIYRAKTGAIELQGDYRAETIWATQDDIVKLYGKDQSVISRHIKNIFKDGEVNEKSNMQKMHIANSDKPVVFYSLDVILAVGYRTNSARAIEFRKWATKTLRDYLVKGYILNAKRLKKSRQMSVKELEKTLKFIQSAIQRRQLDQTEIDGLLSVINGYANSWLLLQQYDEDKLAIRKGKAKEKRRFDYDFVRPAIDELRSSLRTKGEASDLFGNERDQSFKGILGNIYQSFGGKELYGSLEEKAAHLLYFIIKDHPFSDGNKRTGSFLFILFLERNGILYRKNGEKKINDTALVALALLIAESKPAEKDNMVALITNLIA
jgi:death-on-curing family protein